MLGETQYRPSVLVLCFSHGTKSQTSRIPFYFAARRRNRTPPLSASEEREAQQDLDLHAEDLKPAELRKLKQDLDLYNATGRIVTFDKVLRDWVTWDRPRRLLKSKPGVSVPVGASGFQRVHNFIPPLCPHASNPWRTTKDCEMEGYRETVRGKEQWVFCARQHKCHFRVVIPPLRSSEGRYVQGPDVSYDEEGYNMHSPSSSVSAAMPASVPPDLSQPSNTSTSATSSATAASGSMQSVASSQSSHSSGVNRRLDNFEDYKEVLRRVDDVEAFLTEVSATRDHPAADRDLPPPALFWYHSASNPAPFTHREFENSMIGCGMRAFNSSDGVSPDAWHLLSTCTALCAGCRMKFSVDGFRAHTSSGRCPKPGANFSVAPSHTPCHPAVNNDNPPPELVEYHPSSHPPPTPDYFGDSMIGRALLEWNSDVGIPLDAWYTVITARVYCAGCNRVRSFDGDCLHRDTTGKPYCGGRRLGLREGEEEPPVFGKGKGRAF